MNSTPENGAFRPSGDDRAVAAWLLVCCVMVFIMVVLGGATRLTDSGLSMVRWKPLFGILPPLGEAEWRHLFRLYQEGPQYRTLNFWMQVDDFKAIFWLEYLHRLWGRLIGVVFIVPLLWFWLRHRLRPGLLPRLVAMLALGAAQGLLGWYMVKSGLVDRPDVSQYRLTAHLALAFAIYGYMLWVALGLLFPAAMKIHPLRRMAVAVAAWSALAIVAGAFVAGADAGHAYNTFPLMAGEFVPHDMFVLSPWPVNFFENTALVQFTHRIVAETLLGLVLWLWFRGMRAGVDRRAGRALHALALAAAVQVGLGIATLLSEVQIAIAVLHQGGALVLFSTALWLVYALGTLDSAGRAADGSLRPNKTAPAR